MTPSVCAFASVCEEDARWLPQFLAEITRLQVPLAMHFDRCSGPTMQLCLEHPLLRSWTSREDPAVEFDETHKQNVLDRVTGLGFDFAMPMDVDETLEAVGLEKMPEVLKTALDSNFDWIDVPWVNLWEDKQHIRVDGSFGEGHRVKFLNLRSGRWVYMSKAVNGPKLETGEEEIGLYANAPTVVHWGMMTEELRRMHKERWDRIYGKAVGRNPYGFWDMALDPKIKVRTVKHGYF